MFCGVSDREKSSPKMKILWILQSPFITHGNAAKINSYSIVQSRSPHFIFQSFYGAVSVQFKFWRELCQLVFTNFASITLPKHIITYCLWFRWTCRYDDSLISNALNFLLQIIFPANQTWENFDATEVLIVRVLGNIMEHLQFGF